MDQVIGIMLVIVVIGLLADKILFSPWERFLHRRWGTGRVYERDAGLLSLTYDATGNVTAKVAPLPEPSLCARMLPPCISTIALLMARPRPRPSRRISSCSKASKIFSRNAGSIPMPVSVISTVIEFGELL